MSSAQQIANSFVVEFFERLASSPATLGELYGQHAEVTINDFEMGTTEARDGDVASTVEKWAMIVQGSQLRVESVNAAPLYSGVNVFVTLSAVGEMQQYFQITTTLEAYTGGFAVECYYIRHQILSRIGALPIEQPATPVTANDEAATTAAPAAAATPATTAADAAAAATTTSAAADHTTTPAAAAEDKTPKAGEAATADEKNKNNNKHAEGAMNGNGTAGHRDKKGSGDDVAAAATTATAATPRDGDAAANKKTSSDKPAETAAAAASKVKSWAKLASAAPAKHADAAKVIRVVAANAPVAAAAAPATAAAGAAATTTAAAAAPVAAREERGKPHDSAAAARVAAAPPAAAAAGARPAQQSSPFVRRERKPAEPVGDRLIFNVDTPVSDDEVRAALGPLASSIVSLRNQSVRGHVFMDFAVNVKAYDQLRKLMPTVGSCKTRMMVYHQRSRETSN